MPLDFFQFFSSPGQLAVQVNHRVVLDGKLLLQGSHGPGQCGQSGLKLGLLLDQPRLVTLELLQQMLLSEVRFLLQRLELGPEVVLDVPGLRDSRVELSGFRFELRVEVLDGCSLAAVVRLESGTKTYGS